MDVRTQLDRAVRSGVMENEPMSKHTTFRVGGPARYFVMPSSPEEIATCIEIAVKSGTAYTIVGNGSNLLVSDRGFDGLVIALGRNMSEVCVKDERIIAQAGVTLAALAQVAKNGNLTGLEFAAGIPGTLGGAVMMNAGAYGGEMKDVLTRVRTVTADGELKEYTTKELELSYRHSILMERPETVVVAELLLKPGDFRQITERMEELAERRMSKQPLEYASAGSTFKRPEGHFAGALIEQTGLKGVGFGDACVSDKHAGFIINKGKATADEIYRTILLVKERVKEDTGIDLEPEVRFLGDF